VRRCRDAEGVTYTRPLPELRRDDAAEFGGKSANLGDLLAAGIPVPPGFAIGAGAYRAFVRSTGLDGTIASALTHGEDDASKAIGEAMRFAPFPDDLRTELASRYDKLGGPVAVRSSALGEDSHDATHAGQQESYLWVRGIDQLCDAVRECWASLYTPRAIAYRRRLGAAESAMGVTVQAMVDAEVSGVLFTCNPVSGDPSMVAVNASWGLGLSVVGGETTPDDYLVSKVTGEVVRRTISSKEVEYVPDAAGRGTVRVEVEAGRREVACLGDEQLAALVEVGRRCEAHFGSHQDVEWAIERGAGDLHVLQARPVTARKAADPVSASALALVMGTFGAAKQD
jgi:phosphoenolpyruvate synthase/pyruvate phosphate dikinase